MTLAIDDEPVAATRPSRGGYLPYLDGLRGIAILFVLWYHTYGPLFKGGFLGVDLFFVLSGFLITSLLIKEWDRAGRINFGHFYMRRALRLLPAVMLMLAVFVAVCWFTVDDFRRQVQDALIVLFYSANWARALGWKMLYLGHTWSLSIEEQFYLIWPLVFVAMMRVRRSSRSVVLLVAAIAAAAWRATLCWQGATPERLYNGLDTHADGLLIGCALAFFLADLPNDMAVAREPCGEFGVEPAMPLQVARLAGRGPGMIAAAVAAIFLLVVVLIARENHPAMFYAGYFAAAIAGALLVWDLRTRPGSVLRIVTQWPPLIYLGRISYGVYLWHYPIYKALMVLRTRWGISSRWAFYLLVGGGTAILIASVSYRFLEMPFLKLKGRFK